MKHPYPILWLIQSNKHLHSCDVGTSSICWWFLIFLERQGPMILASAGNVGLEHTQPCLVQNNLIELVRRRQKLDGNKVRGGRRKFHRNKLMNDCPVISHCVAIVMCTAKTLLYVLCNKTCTNDCTLIMWSFLFVCCSCFWPLGFFVESAILLGGKVKTFHVCTRYAWQVHTFRF